MGKKLVTEDDLLSGVGGGFGTIGQMGAGRPVRDNPFRDTRSDPAPAAPKVTPVSESAAAEEQEQSAAGVPPKAVPPVARVAAPPVREAPPPIAQSRAKARVPQRVRKTDTYSEKMSTFLSPE